GEGWRVVRHDVPGRWPRPDRHACARLAEVLAAAPDGTTLVVDGLVASAAGDLIAPHTHRLRLVVLLHLPLGAGPSGDGDSPLAEVATQESAVLAAAAAVITTSVWTRQWLLRHYRLRPERLHVAEPGVAPAPVAPGTASGGQLLCVAAVTRSKGHDVLMTALGTLAGGPWRLVSVGATDLEPAYVRELLHRAEEQGNADRVRFPGALTGSALDEAYAAADLLVLPSRGETYGMVVTEALSRGVPVVATSVGGLPATVGAGRNGDRPGLLVPPDDPQALAEALRSWLADGELRARLRAAALQRRATLAGWPATVARVSRVLAEVG
ncbi:MAG: hypothetical protein QOK15_2752, partial [Nocardioidaceae bacterium]|nr:hypothetical protein [Nocardioidaceae bacterium]